MTDNNNQLVTIGSIEQQLAAIANFDLDAIGAHLGAIWDDANQRGDVEAVQRAGYLWDTAQKQHAALTTVTNVAATAVQIGKAVTAQRDAALQEYENLAEAVADGDYDHPLVGGLIEEMEESGIRYAIEFSGDDLINGAFQDFCVTQDDTNRIAEVSTDFVKLLFCDDLEVYSLDLRRKVLDFIISVHPQIVADLEEYEVKEKEQRAVYEARLAAERAARIVAARAYDADPEEVDGDEDLDLDVDD